MQFLAQMDTSLGQGVLLVTTTTWCSLSTLRLTHHLEESQLPDQTISLIDYGPTGLGNAVSVNGDMWYRSPDGFRSFIVARRITEPGNVPLSQEIVRLSKTNGTAVVLRSGALFDNRAAGDVSPFRHALGVAHRGWWWLTTMSCPAWAANQSAWEGAWTGLDMLQVSKCTLTC